MNKVSKYLGLFLLLSLPAYGQERLYDASGTYQGTIRQEGNRLVERGADGTLLGYWITINGQTSHYDAKGNLLGRSR
jgi:hypothetical protein